MNSHKHARLTYARRVELVEELTKGGVGTTQAALDYGVTPQTVRKWLGRFLAGGQASLADASSRPAHSPRTIDESKALLIVELRRRRMTQARIAASVGVSESTVSRVLKRAGLSKLKDLEPAEPVMRYEHEAPGDLLHIDTKKLGRIVRPSHRVTGNRKDTVDGAGWEMLFVAIDDHARVAFTAIHPDEKREQAVTFLRNAVAYYARLGVKVKRLLTDNGSAPIHAVSRNLCPARHHTQIHSTLPTANQWQGRALHPVRLARVGLRLDIPELSTPRQGSRQLAAPLQLPSAS